MSYAPKQFVDVNNGSFDSLKEKLRNRNFVLIQSPFFTMGYGLTKRSKSFKKILMKEALIWSVMRDTKEMEQL